MTGGRLLAQVRADERVVEAYCGGGKYEDVALRHPGTAASCSGALRQPGCITNDDQAPCARDQVFALQQGKNAGDADAGQPADIAHLLLRESNRYHRALGVWGAVAVHQPKQVVAHAALG